MRPATTRQPHKLISRCWLDIAWEGSERKVWVLELHLLSTHLACLRHELPNHLSFAISASGEGEIIAEAHIVEDTATLRAAAQSACIGVL